jgi:hypothetical protein
MRKNGLFSVLGMATLFVIFLVAGCTSKGLEFNDPIIGKWRSPVLATENRYRLFQFNHDGSAIGTLHASNGDVVEQMDGTLQKKGANYVISFNYAGSIPWTFKFQGDNLVLVGDNPQLYTKEANTEIITNQIISNTSPQSENDFIVELTRDGTGVKIKKYTGNALQVIIPTTIQGMPVKEIGTGEHWENILPYNSKVTSVTLSNGIEKINAYAFSGSSILNNVVVPESVTAIGYMAFANSGIISFNWPRKVTVITENIFMDSKITNMVFPEGITEIGEAAFNGCTALTSISVPSTIKKIGRDAFSGCFALSSIIIPDSVSTIEFGQGGAGVFYDCPRIPLATQAALKQLGYNGNF